MHSPLTLIAATALAALSVVPAMAAELTPVGKWRSQDGSSQYQVSFCGGGEELCAKLTWLSESAKADGNAELLNTYVVEGAAPTAPNKWSGTVVYEGDSYDGTVTLVSHDTMKLKGCSGIFCKNFSLVRA